MNTVRISMIIFLSFLSVPGFSQAKNTFVGLYGGGGVAATNNYDVALSGGFEYMKGISYRACIGATVFYQQYSLYYDNEANNEKNGHGFAGYTDRLKSAYIFVAPKFTYGIGKNQRIHFYLDAGIGFNMGGFDSVRKWDYSYDKFGVGNYDSVIDASANIRKMMVRVGFGFKEYIKLGGHWWFTITEDFGYIPKSLTTSTDLTQPWPTKTAYSPRSLNPGYITLQIGFSHTKL